MIKVLHIHTRGIIGGSGTNTLLSMEGLPKDRFEAVLACGCEGPLVEEAKKRNFRVIIIAHMKNEINVFNELCAVKELVGVMRKERFEIVHTHNSKAGILGRVAAKIAGAPIIIHTQHGCAFNYLRSNIIEKNLFILVERLTGKFTDKIIAISHSVKEALLVAGVVPEDRIVIAYSGIEIDKFRQNINREIKKAEFSIPKDYIIIGIVSRLADGKGHEVIINAIPKVLKVNRNIQFVFVGDGPLRTKLELLAKKEKVEDRVTFAGLRDDTPELLHIFDIFCLASEYEGMGRVILEAQAAGLPVVATKVGGIVDIVAENKTAILVAPRDPQALADALIKLIIDDGLRKNMASAAQKFVDYRFSSQKMVGDIISVYEELIRTKIDRPKGVKI